LKNVSGLEAVHRDYAPLGVRVYFVYKSLAHPELVGDYIQPFTLEERLAHARQAEKQLGASIPWLVDPMDNRLKHALGDRPNSEFVIDPQGVIVRKRPWSDPITLRSDLEELVGPVAKITRPEDVNLQVQPPLPAAAEKGVAPRVSRAGMFAIAAAPQIDEEGSPFFAKLRAEAELNLIDGGRGRMYLGFHLDPFHGAHWNNLTKPLRFRLDAPAEVKLAQTSWEAPQLSSAKDGDPREFLLEVEEWPADAAVRLVVDYFACTDDVCHTVRQVYTLRRERDKDGGGARSAGFRGLAPRDLFARLMEGDKNGDGRLVPEELDSIMRPRFTDHDSNQDGVLDGEEIREMARQLARPLEP
jgi:hypothetical protein